ncbi:MAG: nucleotidyl transferase AbiEii/AbiGii toxin family protein [Myxococcaceae bacterium]|nr:nucleotidyl transferase AbiEii/AbiGii toxin family protein [Myxococcaceae bacterium]MBH2006232.1 nucleotidyl transferase AbiEii/AbiGii toxin family protein [Myxococcaceae bacterium]
MHINQLRVLLGLERIVARLEHHSILRKHVIFKGGFVLFKTISHPRFTRDIDASALSLSKSSLINCVTEALRTDLKDDLWYGDITIKELVTHHELGGYRFDCAFQIGSIPLTRQIHKLSRLHLDIGLGDRIPKIPKTQKMIPLIQTNSEISWRVYPPESILAEKLETLCRRSESNSRAKDVFDLLKLLSICKNSKRLETSIQTTFQNRNTPIPPSFFQHISVLNPWVLKHAWNSVSLAGKRDSFEQAWSTLLRHLEELDALLYD